MLLEKTKIYGVDGVGQSDPTLSRTDAAVGLEYTLGKSEVTSDFDNCYPWCEMKELVDESGNVFIKIPKFYTKVTKNENGTYKYQISGCRYDGFSTLFIDGKGNELDYVLVGKYEASGSSERVCSKSGETVLINITVDELRSGCCANGECYQQYDLLIDAIIKQLFMIEFATTNCQSIMKGFTSNGAANLSTGHTDNVKTPSGSYNTSSVDGEHNTNGLSACKYRGIENPWGNVGTWCDGINFKEEKIYICEAPEHYSSDKYDAPYTYVGDKSDESGFVLSIVPFAKAPLLGYVNAIGGSNNTYFSDYYSYSASGGAMVCGGNRSYSNYAGLWCYMETSSESGNAKIGGRLCYKPL